MKSVSDKFITSVKAIWSNYLLQNRYFFIPFLIWVIIGGILLTLYSRNELFFAINRLHTPFLDKLNTVFSAYGRGDIIPIFLVSLLMIPAYRNRNYMLTTLCFGVLIPTTIYFTKVFFDTPRPLKYYQNFPVHTVPWLDNAFETSFPSGHTIGAFGFFLLISLYLPPLKKGWSVLFFFLSLTCGLSRLYLGQHFFVDIYAGSIIGTFLTSIIYIVGKRIFNPTTEIKTHAV